ncbi:5-methylcytosine-specific restriction enzyme subunit McrC [Serratia proteamaculans]|uniref:McrC family protein n=1 Tax=Serratia proteamaculans TaxID=28151 RepID=UPI0021842CFD|nr:McrC family protein [Serratia proteamaculans]CAI2514774.1 5-methylcytosine-specific restriction enzyme subunit McrC [Serratia proteamaculans]
MIKVREYARLTTDEYATPSLDCAIITPATFEWLQDLASGWKGTEPVVLSDGHRSLKLGSYVGYLQSPDGAGIEILPKTSQGADNPLQTRKILQRMLMATLAIKPHTAGPAELLRMDQPLHEWIFSQFLSELQILVSKGLRFDYSRIEEESRFIRGQLRIERQQRQSPARQHLLHINHDVFSPNRLENRLLKTALIYVLAICKNSENWRLSNELSHRMNEVSAETMPQRGMKDWNSSKLMQAYDYVRPWCELILEKMNPNFQQGNHKGVSLLFPMEKLFEKYVEVSLKQQLPSHSQLISHASMEYLVEHTVANGEGAQAMFQLKPDLLLRTQHGDQTLDTKWKLVDQSAYQSDEKYNIAQSDLYQMFAYGHKYQDGQGDMMLIYPRHMAFNQALPPFCYSKTLAVWAVPFCLESQKLLPGSWQEYFPDLTRPDNTRGCV